MATYTGDTNDNTFTGLDEADTALGFGGYDTLRGGGGDDLLDGGDGDDFLDGGDGNDTIEGGDGYNSLYDQAGGGTLRGGNDRDFIITAIVAAGLTTVDAGGGDDFVQASANNGGVISIDGGDGNDTFLIEPRWGGSVTVTGGAGRDIFKLAPRADNFASVWGTATITDFEAGDGGDYLFFDPTSPYDNMLLSTLSNYNDTNPFGTGHLRLVQSGADTHIELDVDGASNGFVYAKLAVLEGVTLTTLSAANFGGYALSGATPAGIVNAGTVNNDNIAGGIGADTLNGNDGNDYIQAGDGRDKIDGGAGGDTIWGGQGNDTLSGDDGDDHLYDQDGSNVLSGGLGNDLLGSDADTGETFTATGGDGNDTIWASAYNGGYGTVNAGAGDDVIETYGIYNKGIVITGGAGRDTYQIRGFDTAITVTDFAAGNGGDNIDIAYLRLHAGLPESGNPFDNGTVRLLQTGGDVLLQLNETGTRFHTIAVLKDVNAAQLTADNFSGYALPAKTAEQYGTGGADSIIGTISDEAIYAGKGDDSVFGDFGDDLISGADGHDTLNGDFGNDTLSGQAGSDSLDGGYGDDQLSGGARWDTLVGGYGNDTLDGGTENDAMYGGHGSDTYVVDHIGDRVYEDDDAWSSPLYTTDTVKASIDYAMAANVEILYLTGTAVSGLGNGLHNSMNGTSGGNFLSGGLGNDSLYGWDGNDNLKGDADHDRLSGGNGNDTLVGGTGNDVLGGGAGADDFVFRSTADNGHDHVVDFQHGIDRLVFTGADYGFAAGHTLAAGEFTAGTAAVGSGAQFVWDAAASKLWWDADGDGAGAAYELALISAGAVVTGDDLFFI